MAVARKKRQMAQVVEIVDRATGEITQGDAELAAMIRDAWNIKQKLDAAKEAYAQLTQKLAARIGSGRTARLVGVARVSVAERQRVVISDAEMLKVVLGGRFDDLVRTVVRFEPEPKLVELASDGDSPLAEHVRECLEVKTSVSVTLRAD